MEIQDPLLKRIGRLADALGVSTYVVGGYVRDRLLGKEVKDTDIVVVGDGVEFARRFADDLGVAKVVEFANFGTAMAPLDDRKVEFVGSRRESYAKETRKPHTTPGTIEEDLMRRDFTVNAMAVLVNSTGQGELLDPYDGRSDLEQRILRTPLDAAATFDDDPLRIMRAFRFAARLEFTVDPAILAAAADMRERLKIVSQERISDEFLKLMMADLPSIGLALMQDTGVMEIIFPEIARLAGVDQRQEFHHKDVFRHTLKVVDNICPSTSNVWLRMVALLHDVAKPKTKAFKEGIGWTFHGHEELGARMVKNLFRRMRLPMEQVPYVEKLVRLHLRPMALVDTEVTDSAVRRMMFDAGDDIDDLMKLCHADITSKNPKLVDRVRRNYELVMQKMVEVEERDRIRSWRPPVDGAEIMELCGLEPGPLVGILKDAVTDAILDGLIPNERDAALFHLHSIKDVLISGYQAGTVKKQPRKHS